MTQNSGLSWVYTTKSWSSCALRYHRCHCNNYIIKWLLFFKIDPLKIELICFYRSTTSAPQWTLVVACIQFDFTNHNFANFLIFVPFYQHWTRRYPWFLLRGSVFSFIGSNSGGLAYKILLSLLIKTSIMAWFEAVVMDHWCFIPSLYFVDHRHKLANDDKCPFQ